MTARSFWLIGVLGAALAVSACGKKETKTDAPDAAAAVAEAQEAGADGGDQKLADENRAASEKFLAETAKKSGVKKTASGLQYEILAEGPKDGLAPAADDIVEMHYVGTKIDGVEFDSSRARGAAARFPLVTVAKSWTEDALKMMSVGDRYRFFVPADLAFGEAGTPGGPIGPNEALIYDIELVDVTNAARNLEAANEFLAENARKHAVKTTESGLQYEVLAEGPADGETPTDANIVKVHYKGTLIDGTEFDSSYARGEPAEFLLAQVIKGWTEGVQLMGVGDKFRFYVPPALGYGETGTPNGPIGPNEALVFEVELLEVR